MSAISDLSIEFAHVHLLNLDERRAGLAALAAKRWAMPIVEIYEREGLKVSTVMMLDDYFASASTDVAKCSRLLQDACETVGVRVDHITYETDCAESVALMQPHLNPRPWNDARQSDPSQLAIRSEWLDNGEPSREWAEREVPGTPLFTSNNQRIDAQVSAGRRSRGHHAIHLDVELWSEFPRQSLRLWACPTLAAWWQLIRLGMLGDGDSDKVTIPSRTQSRIGAPPLPARRTLTLLEPRFLEVEHAVRVILERLILPETWRQRLGEGAQSLDSHEYLKRIAYMFISEEF